MTAHNDFDKMVRLSSIGCGLIVMGLLSLLIWACLFCIVGAVIAPGRVSVTGSVKPIQHKEGGVIQSVLVREGDYVRKDAVLIRMDETQSASQDAILADQWARLQLRKSRLEAEIAGRGWPDASVTAPQTPEAAQRLSVEKALYQARLRLRAEKRQEILAQIRQSGEAVEGLDAQGEAYGRQYALIVSEGAAMEDLYSKGYAPITRVNQYKRQAEDLRAQQANVSSRRAQYRTQASALRMQILQLQSQTQTEAADELKDVEARLAQIGQERRVTVDARQRTELRAPTAGRVMGLHVHSAGDVAGAGEVLMSLVPEGDPLTIEARVDPRHIDQVRARASAHVRFTAFSATTTPQADARIDSVSADALSDPKTGEAYYLVRLNLSAAGVPKALRQKLVAGMPVEVMIETESRSVMSYFLKPLYDQFSRAFREE
jgi:HlyD family secretion protein